MSEVDPMERISEPQGDPVEMINDALKLIMDDLRGWHVGEDRDSMLAQRVRSNIFYEADRNLVGLFQDLYLNSPQHQLQLTTGSELVTATRFRKGAYDMYSSTHDDVEPGTEIAIKEAKHWVIAPYSPDVPKPVEFYTRRVLFIGDRRHQIPLTALAKTICEGGRLELVQLTKEAVD
jgi:hypothetical protein